MWIVAIAWIYVALMMALAEATSPQGTVLLSTELLDADMALSNWYIAPRNGHISLSTAASLRALAARHGLSVFSINHEMHVLRRV